MDKIKARESGVTLVELIIVIVIVGICFISIMSLFVNALRINMENEVRTVATTLAHGKMEEILQTEDYSNTGPSSFSSPFGDYKYEVTVKEWDLADSNSNTTGEIVEVKVSHNLIENVKMRTLFTN